MLRTKSIQAPKEAGDGIRISIMCKPRGDYDMLISALAPCESLLNSYHENEMSWDEYEREFLLEMDNNPDSKRMMQFLITIAEIVDVTILCWEENPEKCHRRLIAGLITEMSNNKTKIMIA